MNMMQFAGDLYLSVEDIRSSGPKQLKIEAVEEGSYDKPVLWFNDNTMLSLNATNTKTLIRNYRRATTGPVKRLSCVLVKRCFRARRGTAFWSSRSALPFRSVNARHLSRT
jgi:hypothetical protein